MQSFKRLIERFFYSPQKRNIIISKFLLPNHDVTDKTKEQFCQLTMIKESDSFMDLKAQSLYIPYQLDQNLCLFREIYDKTSFTLSTQSSHMSCDRCGIEFYETYTNEVLSQSKYISKFNRNFVFRDFLSPYNQKTKYLFEWLQISLGRKTEKQMFEDGTENEITLSTNFVGVKGEDISEVGNVWWGDSAIIWRVNEQSYSKLDEGLFFIGSNGLLFLSPKRHDYFPYKKIRRISEDDETLIIMLTDRKRPLLFETSDSDRFAGLYNNKHRLKPELLEKPIGSFEPKIEDTAGVTHCKGCGEQVTSHESIFCISCGASI